jgi:hypothetical protein
MVNHLEFGFDPEARTLTILGRAYDFNVLMRTLIITCAYILLRPYLLKLTSRHQERDHDREPTEADEMSSPAATGRVAPGGEEDSDGEDNSWGAKARRRQRALKQEAMDEDREADEEEDAELNALLED